MKRRSRTRRILKWAGLAGCTLIGAAWVASGFWTIGWRWTSSSIRVNVGVIEVNRFTYSVDGSVCGPRFNQLSVRRLWPSTRFVWPQHRNLLSGPSSTVSG